MTFVKGDRVRYRSAPTPGRSNQWAESWSGWTGVVLSQHLGDMTMVEWDRGGLGYPNTFNLEKIEMAHTFKIGDRVRYTGDASPAFLGALGTVHRTPESSNVDIAWDNHSRLGLAHPVRGVYPCSLELIGPSIDTTKPLQVRGTVGGNRGVVFVTMTSEGHILVTEPGRTGWMMFDINGNFMRSDTGAGSALRLSNVKPAKATWLRHVTVNDKTVKLHVTTLDGVVTGVEWLK